MPNKFLLFFILVTTVFGFPLLSLKFVSIPYFWIFIIWALTALFGLIRSKNSNWKAIYLTGAVAFVTFGIFELYLYSTNINYADFRIEYTDDKGNIVRNAAKNDLLGYAPVKDRILSAKKYYKDDIIYNVKYTIDGTGLRKVPKIDKLGEDKKCILFFGGSFTFGEGVNDNESLPYITQMKSDNNFQTYNFGFSGYGPHQMLAAIENEYVKNITNCTPKFAVYSGMTGHIERSAGLAPWDTNGPRYVLKNGDVTHEAKFEDKRTLRTRIISQLKKSNILKNSIIKYISKRKRYNNETTALYLEIIDKARKVFENSFAESEFHIIVYDHYWDGTDKYWGKLVLKELKRRKINVHLITDILPRWPSEASKYQISNHDNHPNPRAYELIADYIINNVTAYNSSIKKNKFK